MPDSELTSLGAVELTRRARAGDVSCRQIVEAFLEQIARVDGAIHAVAAPRFEQARDEARAADERQARGEPLGSLHGAPLSLKENYLLAGAPTTIGLTALRGRLAESDGPLVARARGAGAVVLCKTNIPQLMLWHECVNPVYGRTLHPENPARSPGGSSGGEAALIAAGGSPLGLGSDMGGSIRVPAHFCGVCGFKPTSKRLPCVGTLGNFRGMEAIAKDAGPLARRVADLELLLAALAPGEFAALSARATLPAEAMTPRVCRVGFWQDDGCFPVAPAARRAVRAAADALANRGMEVEEFSPPDAPEAVRLYFGLCAADGGADSRRLLAGSEVDPSVRRLLRLGNAPGWLRPALACLLRAAGRVRQAELAAVARPLSADEYWRLCQRRAEYVDRFWRAMSARGLHSLLTPPHALPALTHGAGVPLLPAASSSLLFNLLGAPAGVVPITRVRPGEESDRPPSRDPIDRAAARVEAGSAGLPIGVQVAAPPGDDALALALMRALEEDFPAARRDGA